jgi:hypothetical protein
MRNKAKTTGLWKIWGACLALAAVSSPALTMDDLRALPGLTPQKFVRRFSEFNYEYNAEIQSPSDFLARETGDCDDFALVASIIFSEKGFHPRLISVRLRNISHVVCYFPETHSYIDYNNRSYLFTTTASDGTLPDIARKVARSLRLEWSSAAEFNFVEGSRELVARTENPRALVAAR